MGDKSTLLLIKQVVVQNCFFNNPREPNWRARIERAEKQILFEDKLTNNQWTATK
jgi:hypothetical protein